MTVIHCYLERENYKVLKFRMNNFSCFEKTASLFQASSSNKRRTSKASKSNKRLNKHLLEEIRYLFL